MFLNGNKAHELQKKVGYIRCVVIYSLSTGENIKNNKNSLITKKSYCANFTWWQNMCNVHLKANILNNEIS